MSNNTPRISLSRIMVAGKPAAQFAIADAHKGPAMRDAIKAAGWTLRAGISNYYTIDCTTREQIDATRAMLSAYFNPNSEFIG